MDDSPLDGLSSLIQLSGVSVPTRARFIGEALVSSTLASVTLGLSCGMVGAIVTPFGPLVPFLCGAWTGYSLGLVNYWRTSQRLAIDYARLYPTLLAHALGSERFLIVPSPVVKASEQVLLLESSKNRQNDNNAMNNDNNEEDEDTLAKKTNISSSTVPTLEEWILQGGLGRLSWSILAAQSCRSDVEELERQRRQTLMDQHKERYYD
jgi:hypothetical protein